MHWLGRSLLHGVDSAFISFHFGLLGLDFLPFWLFGPSFSFILAFWAFISFHFGFLNVHLPFWAFISFHFGLLGLHFLSFWPFRLSFPFILAFWALFPFILAFWAFISFLPSSGCPWGPPHKLPKTVCFAFVQYKEFSRTRRGFIFQILAFWASIPHFGLLGLDFLSLWPLGPSFSFILAFWAFISFHFGLWAFICPFGPSFPFILAFWAFICPFGPSILSFWPEGLSGCTRAVSLHTQQGGTVARRPTSEGARAIKPARAHRTGALQADERSPRIRNPKP